MNGVTVKRRKRDVEMVEEEEGEKTGGEGTWKRRGEGSGGRDGAGGDGTGGRDGAGGGSTGGRDEGRRRQFRRKWWRRQVEMINWDETEWTG